MYVLLYVCTRMWRLDSTIVVLNCIQLNFFETGSVAEPEIYQFDKSGFPETLIVVLTKI